MRLLTELLKQIAINLTADLAIQAGAIAGASGNIGNDFVNGKRGSDLLDSAIAGSSTGSVAARWAG
ncbi:hypothetical protein [Amycolatopsis sp. 195334CR]|uniref:hypothetical protein n=1 Tax=Amycolatopsis sp. 195334CR TaxID=2814588 RepID=UPI001A8C9442|nr:hypothetical protein [Amycolatopsis sp. 195334CR]MBN6034759.1 hypothetical protein [Amycolatopsis sp. 195334CR]